MLVIQPDSIELVTRPQVEQKNHVKIKWVLPQIMRYGLSYHVYKRIACCEWLIS